MCDGTGGMVREGFQRVSRFSKPEDRRGPTRSMHSQITIQTTYSLYKAHTLTCHHMIAIVENDKYFVPPQRLKPPTPSPMDRAVSPYKQTIPREANSERVCDCHSTTLTLAVNANVIMSIYKISLARHIKVSTPSGSKSRPRRLTVTHNPDPMSGGK